MVAHRRTGGHVVHVVDQRRIVMALYPTGRPGCRETSTLPDAVGGQITGGGASTKRILDYQPLDPLAVLHIFAKQPFASGLQGAAIIRLS